MLLVLVLKHSIKHLEVFTDVEEIEFRTIEGIVTISENKGWENLEELKIIARNGDIVIRNMNNIERFLIQEEVKKEN